jgi:putative addiction module killer protein
MCSRRVTVFGPLLVFRMAFDSLSAGLFGGWESVGGGVCELRVDHGPGYRVYYGQDGNTLILLLCGGTKRTQAKDIEKAHAYWKDYKARAA